jgi:hypothetical protein
LDVGQHLTLYRDVLAYDKRQCGVHRRLNPGGATEPSSHLPVSAEASFTTGQNTILPSNVYSAAVPSIAGNGSNNPFSALEVAFILNVPGVNADTLVNNVVFSFGTRAGNNVPVNPLTVPDGGTTIMLLGCGLAGFGLMRTKLA